MALNVIILGSAESWHGQALQRAFAGRGIEPAFYPVTGVQAQLGSESRVVAGETVLSQADLVLVREVPGGTLEQVIYRMDALHQLENGGVWLINSPGAIEKMVDKYYTLSLLQEAGLRVPETRVMESPLDALEAFEALGGDVVVKPLFGSRGVGMVRLTDAETAGRVFKALALGGYVYYLQRFIEHDNRDLRVLVSDEECLAAMERVSDGWKTNLAAGGRAMPFSLTREVEEASLAAARAVQATYCGVDLMLSQSGELYVVEVNSMPSWQGLQQVTGFDIAEELVTQWVKKI